MSPGKAMPLMLGIEELQWDQVSIKSNMKYRTLLLSALTALSVLGDNQGRAADNMASIAIAPATGVVTLTPQWAVGGSLAGFHFMAQDLSLGGGATQFYSIKGTTIPVGGDILAFDRYIAASGAATPHNDIGSKLTPSSYSALTSADPDVGYGSVNFYLIHQKIIHSKTSFSQNPKNPYYIYRSTITPPESRRRHYIYRCGFGKIHKSAFPIKIIINNSTAL